MVQAKSLKDWLELEAVPVDVTHRGLTFTVQAFPERLTQALFDEARAAGEAGGNYDVTLFSKFVTGWSLAEEFGEAAIRAMSKSLKLAILKAVQDESGNPTQAVSAGNSESSS